MTCDPERLTGYVDGELSPEEAAQVADHLRGCASCREQAEAERSLRDGLRALPSPEPRPGFERELRQRIRAARPSPFRFLLPLAAVLVVSLLWAARSPAVVAWELSRDHDHCYGSERLPVEVFTSDAGRAVAQLADEADLRLALPDAAGRLELVGGRRCPIADRRVVHLFYAADKGRISVFLIPGDVRVGRRYASEVRANAVRILRVSGALVGIVGEDEEDVAAFEQSLLQTPA